MRNRESEAMTMYHEPVRGGAAPLHAHRTAQKLANFALKYADALHSPMPERRYLDVGCGNGFITAHVAAAFDTVVGIDMELKRLEDFRARVEQTEKYTILQMSADALDFPTSSFAMLTAFEVLEHVSRLAETVNEMVRVCQPGGVIIISVPQVWFPFENHGIQIGQRVIERKIPLLPYIRPLHRSYSLARVFSSREMDRLFIPRGMHLLETAYIAPQFERAAARKGSWEGKLRFLRSFLNSCETVPLLKQIIGVSMLKAYRKTMT